MSDAFKKKKESSALRSVLTLTIIGIICAIAITLAYNLTSPVIAANEEERLFNMIQKIMPTEDFEIITIEDEDEEVYVGRRNDEVIGITVPGTGKGFASFGDPDVNILTLFCPDGIVRDVLVLSHQQTRGIGDVIEEPDFLSQFKDKDTDLTSEESALMEQVDIISGATQSCEAVVEAVVNSTHLYKQAVKQIFNNN